MTRHRKPRSPIDPRASWPDLYDTFSALPHYKLASLAAALVTRDTDRQIEILCHCRHPRDPHSLARSGGRLHEPRLYRRLARLLETK